MKTIASFDIYDTCLARTCGTAANFFDVLSYKVFTCPVTEQIRQTFVISRVEADLKNLNDNKTIDDIYESFSFRHPSLLPISDLKSIELNLEKELTVPILNTKHTIEQLREKNVHIIFISDMYLTSNFLKSLLRKFDFYRDEDSIYVSCELGKTKYTGDLFDYISKKESIHFSNWHHYGDNIRSDFEIPRRLGIKCTLVNEGYTPYQEQWIKKDVGFGAKIGYIAAGLSRAISCSSSPDPQKPITLDIIAPLYTSFVVRIMQHAKTNGIRRLYFCARDTRCLYEIAQKLSCEYPQISIHYLKISQQALYEGDNDAKIKYFDYIGLASNIEKTAIVDIRSTGKTLKILNNLLTENGYKETFGYFFELFCGGEIMYNIGDYYCESNHVYNSIQSDSLREAVKLHWPIFEMFFSIHNEAKTVGYSIIDGTPCPIYYDKNDGVECKILDKEHVSATRLSLINKYVDGFIKLGLINFSNEIFNIIALPTLSEFFSNPKAIYLKSLTSFYVRDENSLRLKPYVEKKPRFYFCTKNSKNMHWRKGSKNYSTHQ